MEALHTPEIKKFIEEKYKGAVVPASNVYNKRDRISGLFLLS